MVIVACACDGAAFNRVGDGGNLIEVQTEVGHIRCLFIYREGIGRIGAHFNAVQGPVDKGITHICCGSQRAFRTMIVIAGATH